MKKYTSSFTYLFYYEWDIVEHIRNIYYFVKTIYEVVNLII